jgi:Tfp pilus assembly protein PilO
MEEENTTSPSTRRKIDSMVRDLDSIVRLLQQASLEQVQLDVVEIENRIDTMEEQLGSPTVTLNE